MVALKVWAQRKLSKRSKENPESLVYTDAQTAAGFILRLFFSLREETEGSHSWRSVITKVCFMQESQWRRI